MPSRRLHTPNHASVVYCLAAGGMTYVGVTNNMHRRLRQHNQELRGGARSTKRRRPHGERWRLHFLVSGLPERRVALQLEWRLHGHVALPARHVNPFGDGSAARRAWQLFWALQEERVTENAPRTADLPPFTVYWADARDTATARERCPVPWPAQVRHVHAATRAPFALRPGDARDEGT